MARAIVRAEIGDSRLEIVILPTRAALARAAATRFVAIAQDALRARGRFTVALSGGATPRALYALLASPEFSAQVDWARAHLFWGDERMVPPDHPDSNFKMANAALLSRVPIPPENVHRIRTELSPDDAARAYEDELRQLQTAPTTTQSRPPSAKRQPAKAGLALSLPRLAVARFDLILLGLGADGHTASLFPRAPALQEQTRWVAAQFIEKLQSDRITLTAPVINAARNVLFLVAGADKARAARAVLRGAYRPNELPAQLVKPAAGAAVWLFDQEAASEL